VGHPEGAGLVGFPVPSVRAGGAIAVIDSPLSRTRVTVLQIFANGQITLFEVLSWSAPSPLGHAHEEPM
jgi:hypothetical protein